MYEVGGLLLGVDKVAFGGGHAPEARGGGGLGGGEARGVSANWHAAQVGM